MLDMHLALGWGGVVDMGDIPKMKKTYSLKEFAARKVVNSPWGVGWVGGFWEEILFDLDLER